MAHLYIPLLLGLEVWSQNPPVALAPGDLILSTGLSGYCIDEAFIHTPQTQ